MNEDSEIKYLGELQRLDLKPNDVFVLSTSCKLTSEQLEKLNQYWRSLMPNNKVIILSDNFKLGVINENEVNIKE